MTSTIPDATSLQGTVDYRYDFKRQLTLEESDRVSGYSYANAFDGAGNATTFRNDPHSYNDDNQLTGPATYVYDGNGNPTTFGGTSLSFDPSTSLRTGSENRMTGYGTALTAGYRGDGLRAWKQPGGGSKTYFLYDGISVLCELDNTGTVSAASTYGANGLLSRGSTQYQFDPLGDAVLLLDGSGDVTAAQGFDAWGNALVTATGPFGYRARYGYFADAETGLVALAYRYYAPGVGRFVNRDPLFPLVQSSLYVYVRNTAVDQIDSAGLFPWAFVGNFVRMVCKWLAFSNKCDGDTCRGPFGPAAMHDAALYGVGALLGAGTLTINANALEGYGIAYGSSLGGISVVEGWASGDWWGVAGGLVSLIAPPLIATFLGGPWLIAGFLAYLVGECVFGLLQGIRLCNLQHAEGG